LKPFVIVDSLPPPILASIYSTILGKFCIQTCILDLAYHHMYAIINENSSKPRLFITFCDTENTCCDTYDSFFSILRANNQKYVKVPRYFFYILVYFDVSDYLSSELKKTVTFLKEMPSRWQLFCFEPEQNDMSNLSRFGNIVQMLCPFSVWTLINFYGWFWDFLPRAQWAWLEIPDIFFHGKYFFLYKTASKSLW